MSFCAVPGMTPVKHHRKVVAEEGTSWMESASMPDLAARWFCWSGGAGSSSTPTLGSPDSRLELLVAQAAAKSGRGTQL